MEDPNIVVFPDYTTNDFEKERNPFINAGLTPLQAANALWNHWLILNNRDKVLKLWHRRELTNSKCNKTKTKPTSF